jgi:hypothetical protein
MAWIMNVETDLMTIVVKFPASWGTMQKDSGGAPQLKGARFFSFEELKACTENFSDSYEIGAGGYGKVTTENRISTSIHVPEIWRGTAQIVETK